MDVSEITVLQALLLILLGKKYVLLYLAFYILK